MNNNTLLTRKEAAALSLNLGHENLAITLGNYYQPSPEQQFDILSKVGRAKDDTHSEVMEFVRMQMEKERHTIK